MQYWDDVSLTAVKRIMDQAGASVRHPSMESLRGQLDSMINEYFDGTVEVPAEQWIELGANAFALGVVLGLITDNDRDFAIKTARFVTGKQRDYGTENVARFGGRGLLVRAHDKVARLENLRGSGKTPANETISDTVIDLIGYSIVGIMWAEDDFFQPLNPSPDLMTVAEVEAQHALQRHLL